MVMEPYAAKSVSLQSIMIAQSGRWGGGSQDGDGAC